jgi:mycothiol synthase
MRDAQSGELWGYSVLDGEVAEGAVRPERRRLGVGHALAAEAIRLGANQAWAHANLPAAQQLASAFLAQPVRRLLVLGVPASRIDSTPPQFPDGFRLRTYAGPADDEALLEVNRAAFVDLPDQGSWSADDLAARISAPWFSAHDLLLLVDQSTAGIAGFHWTKIHPSGVGEVYVVALSPRYRSRGLGTLLIRAGLVHLLARGCPEVLLFVDADNTRARHAYDRLGFTVTREDILYQLTEPVSGMVGT